MYIFPCVEFLVRDDKTNFDGTILTRLDAVKVARQQIVEICDAQLKETINANVCPQHSRFLLYDIRQQIV